MNAEVIGEGGRLAGVGIASAITLEFLGLPIQPIVWALIGGVIGSGWAKPTGPVRAALTYLAASLLSAIIGSAIAAQYWLGASLAVNVWAAWVAVIFHPSLAAMIERVPAAFDVLLAALGKRNAP